MSKKEQATFIWEHQYLIVRKADDLSEQDQADLALLFQIAPALKLFRQFNQQFYRLFAKGNQTICQHGPPPTWSAILYTKPMPFWPKHSINKDKFDKMIVFLGWENGQRTNNHVERNNRVFRMMQKTRYKRRKPHTIAKAPGVGTLCRMMEHPLYPDKISALPFVLKRQPS